MILKGHTSDAMFVLRQALQEVHELELKVSAHELAGEGGMHATPTDVQEGVPAIARLLEVCLSIISVIVITISLILSVLFCRDCCSGLGGPAVCRSRAGNSVQENHFFAPLLERCARETRARVYFFCLHA